MDSSLSLIDNGFVDGLRHSLAAQAVSSVGPIRRPRHWSLARASRQRLQNLWFGQSHRSLVH